MASLFESGRVHDIKNSYGNAEHAYESLGRGRRIRVDSLPRDIHLISTEKRGSSTIDKEKSLRYLLFHERQSTLKRIEQLPAIFNEDGNIAFEGTYANDQKITDIISAHAKRSGDKKAEMKGARLNHVYGDIFEQVAADCYIALSQQEGGTILGKAGTTVLYGSLLEWKRTENGDTVFNKSGLSIPDNTVMKQGRITTVLEATISQGQKYFTHKVEMFDQNKDRIQNTEMLSDAQLLFLVPSNNEYSTIKSIPKLRDRPDIDVIQLPISLESVENFTNRLLHISPRVVFSRTRSN